MKYLVYFSILIIFSSCSEKETNFDWLLGSWERTNAKEGTKTFEYWSKKSNTEYIGLGCTLKATDTVFKENLRLLKINSIWNIEVTGVNESPTFFKFTKQTTTSFSCENKQNEFPKRIDYSFDRNNLNAVIADDSTEISFVFKQK